MNIVLIAIIVLLVVTKTGRGLVKRVLNLVWMFVAGIMFLLRKANEKDHCEDVGNILVSAVKSKPVQDAKVKIQEKAVVAGSNIKEGAKSGFDELKKEFGHFSNAFGTAYKESKENKLDDILK